ncbi:MAG: anti-sigma factor family protein [Gemmatimonadota bacterium]
MDHRTDGELQAYLDAELPSEEMVLMAGHLKVCTDCRVRLGELRMAGEHFQRAVDEIDSLLGPQSPAIPLRPRAGSTKGARRTALGRRAVSRAAILLLLAAGAAAAVVPGSPLRELIGRLVSQRAQPALVQVPALPVEQAAPESAGIPSVTVAPLDGSVHVRVRRFVSGSIVRVRFGPGPDARVTLVSGHEDARFSVGPGSLLVDGMGSSAAAEILVELPRGTNSATVDVDGRRSLVASPDGLRRPGDSGGTPADEVVLRVGG